MIRIPALLGAFLALATPVAAAPITFDTLPGFGDTQFNALIASGAFAEDSIGETRGGTQGANGGDFELGILNVTPPGPGGPTAQQRQFSFQSGRAYSFELQLSLEPNGDQRVRYAFDTGQGGANVEMIDTGPNVIQQGVENINSIYIRTRSNGGGDSFRIDNLALTAGGQTQTTNLSVFSEDGMTVDYMLISGFTGEFLLTGTQTLTFPGDLPPTRSRLAQQIKVGVTAIPLPASLVFLLAGIGGLGALGWLRRVQAQPVA